MNIDLLKDTLDSNQVASRQQAGFSLSYIEGWWAIAEANRIFGFDGWMRETVKCEEVSRHQYQKNGNDMYKVGYMASVKVTVFHEAKSYDDKNGVENKDLVIVRTGVGLGSGISKDLFDAIEGAAKEAETDAMKRALITFGNPFGLALYDKEQRFVEDHSARFIKAAKLAIKAGNKTDMKAIADEIRVDAVKKQTLWSNLGEVERKALTTMLTGEG